MRRFVEVAIIIFVISLVASCYGQMRIESEKNTTAPTSHESGPKSVEISREIESPTLTTWEPHPTSPLPLKILTRPHFTIGYDEAAKNPAWVAYHLVGPITTHGSEKRPSTFATDFKTAAHVSHSDYSNSGFDRGHMCPAYALFSRAGDDAMRETFIMSNVIPQYHGLNAGEWEQLETVIAGRHGHGDGWAGTYGSVWVINGPIYDMRPASDQLRNGTWIPTACFSVVLRQTEGRWIALAVIMPNEKVVAGPVSRYLTQIATINRATSLDLLVGMDEVAKSRIEKERATELWR